MNAVTGSDIKIVGIKNEAVFYVLQTLPFYPEYGRLLFLADGISQHQVTGIKYIEDCKKSKVIPYSKTRFTFDDHSNFFQESRVRDPLMQCNPENMPLLFHYLLHGGRINEIEINFGNRPWVSRGYTQFRTHLLDEFKKEGYLPVEGQLWINSDRQYNMEDGLIIRGSLGRNGEFTNELELRLDRQTDEGQNMRFSDWFTLIGSKYSPS